MDKGSLQARQYAFPYHYIPVMGRGFCARDRWLEWGWEYAAYQEYLADVVLSLCPKDVLDVGCGDGYFINQLALREASAGIRFRGIDVDDRAIALAAAMGAADRFSAMDVSDLVDEFDVVTAIEVMEHIPDANVAEFVHALIARVRPGGHLVVTVPSDAIAVIPKHYRHYSEQMLRSLVMDAAARTDRDLVECRVFRIFPNRFAYNVARKMLMNRLWRVGTGASDRFMWRWSQSLVKSNASTGKHVVAIARLK